MTPPTKEPRAGYLQDLDSGEIRPVQKKEHSPFHKMVIVSYRDHDRVECTECDFEERI